MQQPVPVGTVTLKGECLLSQMGHPSKSDKGALRMRAQTQKGKGPFTTTTQLNTTRTSFDKNNRTKKKEQCGKREYTHRHTYDQQKSRNVHLHYRSALSYWLQSLVKGWGERGGEGMERALADRYRLLSFGRGLGGGRPTVKQVCAFLI
ncbi:hypothetical protein CDAR_54081 [Caerostris darwini]|uniref:Uncharacterized protein n=1 Tax=Caerostris darwini TaxID=1538125 RepID=A0AAV4MDK4_9ARAC|nr:hypothetical protein CDAR_54081 [Caerostris darwini]